MAPAACAGKRVRARPHDAAEEAPGSRKRRKEAAEDAAGPRGAAHASAALTTFSDGLFVREIIQYLGAEELHKLRCLSRQWRDAVQGIRHLRFGRGCIGLPPLRFDRLLAGLCAMLSGRRLASEPGAYASCGSSGTDDDDDNEEEKEDDALPAATNVAARIRQRQHQAAALAMGREAHLSSTAPLLAPARRGRGGAAARPRCSVRSVDLSGARMTDRGALACLEAFAESLEELSLSYCLLLTDATLEGLPAMPRLRRLSLRGCRKLCIGEAATSALLSRAPRLRELDAGYTLGGIEEVRRLALLRPSLRVDFRGAPAMADLCVQSGASGTHRGRSSVLRTFLEALRSNDAAAAHRCLASCGGGGSAALRSVLLEGPHTMFQMSGLMLGAHYASLALCEALLRHGADVGATDVQGLTPLHYAAQSGDAAVVAQLLLAGADARRLCRRGVSALSTAAACGRAAVVALLLSSVEVADVADEAGATALHHAVQGGHFAVAQLLLCHSAAGAAALRADDAPGEDAGAGAGAAPRAWAPGDAADLEVFEALRAATVGFGSGERSLRATLWECGHRPDGREGLRAPRGCVFGRRWARRAASDVNAATHLGKTALHVAAFRGDAAMLRLLLKHGAAANARDAQGWSPLHYAAQMGHAKCAALLLASGADAEAACRRGVSVLASAASCGMVDVVEALLVHSERLRDAADASGATALHHAAQAGHARVVEALLRSGRCAVDAKTARGKTALHLGAYMGHLGVVKRLLEAGACVDAGTKKGRTALYYAARAGHSAVTDALLVASASPEGTAANGGCDRRSCRSPLVRSCRRGHAMVVRSLVQFGASVKGTLGRRALQDAVVNGHDTVVRYLLDGGASATALLPVGKAPLHAAVGSGRLHIARMLLAAGARPMQRDAAGKTAIHYAKGKKQILRDLKACV